MRYDTLIIGAGMSGLAAGIRLAQYDRPVAILERHSLWGGLNSFYKLGGRQFDVGLHALTNYAAKGARGAPLTKILRQLRLSWDDLRLGEQRGSEIRFPDLRLRFSNDPALLRDEIAAAFPDQVDGYDRVVELVRTTEMGETDGPTVTHGARAVLEQHLSDPLLVDALLLPVCWYGSAAEDEPDWLQFAILFRSIFLEGLCRPEGGIRPVLDTLRRRFRELGGELRMRTGVQRILVKDGRACGVVLDDGTEVEADRILSSAGWVETMELAGQRSERVPEAEVGQLTFLEAISVLDVRPTELGVDCATAFYSRHPRLRYRAPDTLVDPMSGVLSAPDNFEASEPTPEGCIRVTVLAHPTRWMELPEERYREEKERCVEEALASAAEVFGDWRPNTVFRDAFTPRTIRHYTDRVNGAVYGSPVKRRDGRTGIGDLFLIGTDQGYLGVVGALMSGISMANMHALAAPTTTARA
jgi:phytoene dehydrogenase-like protein